MPIKNPVVWGVVVGTLHYFGARYPEWQQVIYSVLIALGAGGGAAIIRGLNGGGDSNGTNGDSPSHPSSRPGPPTR